MHQRGVKSKGTSPSKNKRCTNFKQKSQKINLDQRRARLTTVPLTTQELIRNELKKNRNYSKIELIQHFYRKPKEQKNDGRQVW